MSSLHLIYHNLLLNKDYKTNQDILDVEPFTENRQSVMYFLYIILHIQSKRVYKKKSRIRGSNSHYEFS